MTTDLTTTTGRSSRYTELTIGSESGLTRMERIATHLASSGAFKDARQMAQAFAKLAIGEELGVGPSASMSQIYLFDGKVTFGASLIASLVKQSGVYKYRVIESTNEKCVIHWFELEAKKWENVGVSEFTIEEAKGAGLLGKQNWKAYPSDMLFARALTRGARRYCPDVFGGGSVYTPDEIGGVTDAQGDPVVVDGGHVDARPAQRNAEETPTPQQKAKAAIANLRAQVGDDQANEMCRGNLAANFGGKTFDQLTDAELQRFAKSIERVEPAASDDEPVDVPFEDIPNDAPVVERITDEQLTQLRTLAKEGGLTDDECKQLACHVAGVDSRAEIPADRLQDVIQAITEAAEAKTLGGQS